MNVISYTDDCYLDSAVRRLFFSEPSSYLENNIYIELANALLDCIVLFNDKKPAESLIQLSTYSALKSGDTFFVITDTVPADIITRFIPKTCRIIVQSAKSPLTEWLGVLKLFAEKKENNGSLDDIHKPLLTYAEKKFLDALNRTQTQGEFAKSHSITPKTASAHKRSVMRKLGVHHTPQLLRYVNTHSFVQMLAHL